MLARSRIIGGHFSVRRFAQARYKVEDYLGELMKKAQPQKPQARWDFAEVLK